MNAQITLKGERVSGATPQMVPVILTKMGFTQILIKKY